MKVIVRLAAAAAVSAICGAAAGADLYVEGFDSAEAAKVVENHAGAAFVEYVDYSSMRVGSVVHSIPEAPRRVEVRVPSPGPGSWIPPTRGTFRFPGHPLHAPPVRTRSRRSVMRKIHDGQPGRHRPSAQGIDLQDRKTGGRSGRKFEQLAKKWSKNV